VAGRLTGIHRYPVKSMAGESLQRATVEARGLVGDRAWAIRDADGKLGSGKSSRRFRRMEGLLALAASYDADGVPVIETADGRVWRADEPAVHDALSQQVGRPVTLARESDVSHFDEGPVHLVTSASLDRLRDLRGAPVAAAHTRANLVLGTDDEPGFLEDGWVGRRLAVGAGLVLAVRARMPRCVMVTLPQRGVAGDGGLLQTITDANQGDLGIVADVVAPGEVRLGDEAHLLD
jgi:uncharacterized protein YcbX